MSYRNLEGHVNAKDRFFVCATNPDKSGGGVLESFNDLSAAHILQRLAIMEGYTQVQVLTWDEMMSEDKED